MVLTQLVDLSAYSVQLLLQLYRHDGDLAGIDDVGHAVDLVLEGWRLTRAVQIQRRSRVELCHAGMEKERFESQREPHGNLITLRL